MLMRWFDRLFRRRDRLAPVIALHAALVDQAVNPDFYRDGGVADTVEGRFEMVALHVILVMRRLAAIGMADAASPASDLSQDLSEVTFLQLDRSLREAGVGDVAVPKRMKKYASGFFGRAEAYETALAAQDREGLAQALARNALDGREGNAVALAAYMQEADMRLSRLDFAAIVAARFAWPAFVPESAGRDMSAERDKLADKDMPHE